MSEDVALRVASITKFPELLEKVNNIEKGEKISMCESLDLMREYSRNEGRRKGRKEGRNEGRKEGLSKGLKEGKKLGIEEGVKRGIQLEKQKNSLSLKKSIQMMISKGFDLTTIAECLFLTENQIKEYL